MTERRTPPGGIPSGARAAGAPLYSLLALLPELAVLGPLREGLLVASQADATRRWEHDRSYHTLDSRLLDAGRVERVVHSVAQEESARLGRLLRSVGTVLEAWAAGRREECVRALESLVEHLQDDGRHQEAAAFLEIALAESAGLEDRLREGRICRRFGKSCWRLGRLDRAVELYARAGEIFGQLGERELEVVAFQGLGNVRAAQGRWGEAEAHHRVGLALCRDDELVLRGQFFNNLSQVTRRQGRLDEAAEWQERATGIWAEADSPVDRVIGLNNGGLLQLARGDLEEARDLLVQGLTGAGSDLEKAALLVNLAQVEIRAGDLERAEHLAREAEEFAILAHASDLLIEAYTVLGVTWRERGDLQGVVFFEKAVELAADGRFPLARARAHLEYGRLRRVLGDDEEGRAHLKLARSICESVGARIDLEEVLAELE